MTKPYVVSIVQLPPPVTGLSAVNERVVRDLEGSGLLLRKVDVAPPENWPQRLKPLGRMLRVAGAAVSMVGARASGARVLYMPCDGGAGLVFNVGLAATARILGYELVVHHHSFAYLNTYSHLMDMLIRAAPRRTKHLALCARMSDMLNERYASALSNGEHRTKVLPNAFMVAETDAVEPSASTHLTLGHLSNLSEEKGALRFIEIFVRLRQGGLPVRALLAGPATSRDIQAAIAKTTEAFPHDFEWIGPVYGSQKDRFYESVDVFVFPSFYKNEAQPLVLLEAMAKGATLVSTGRGCMGCDHGDSPGIVLPEADFVDQAEAWLRKFTASFDREADRAAARTRFAKLKQNADAALREFLLSPFG